MDLSTERKKIDALDTQIVALLEQRMAAVSTIALIKKENQIDVLDSGREKQVLEKIGLSVSNESYKETIVATFADIMKQSRAYQAQQNKEG